MARYLCWETKRGIWMIGFSWRLLRGDRFWTRLLPSLDRSNDTFACCDWVMVHWLCFSFDYLSKDWLDFCDEHWRPPVQK